MTLAQAEMSAPPTKGSEELIEILGDTLGDISGDIRRGQFKQHRTASGEVSEGFNRVRSALQSRLIAVHERFIAIHEDEALEARALLRLGRCLERWIPDVSIEPARQGVCGFADISCLRSQWHEISMQHPERGGTQELMRKLMHGVRHDLMHDVMHHARQSQSQPHVADSWRVPMMPALIGSLAGCEQLFRRMYGSERFLMERIQSNFAAFGIHVRVASASTVGAALAVARFGSSKLQLGAVGRDIVGRSVCPMPSGGSHVQPTLLGGRSSFVFAIRTGDEAEALSMLPIEALGIHAHEAESLRSVEVSTIGQLARLRRSGVAARFHEQRPDSEYSRARHEHVGASGQSTLFAESKASVGSSSHTEILNTCQEASSRIDAGHEEDSPRTRNSTRNSTQNRRHIRHVHTAAVLSLLDQALGNCGAVGSARTFLRHRDPVKLSHDFDGPVTHRETVLIACASMIDQLCHKLSLRGEGLRGVRWIFRHADLPADLSTDRVESVAKPKAFREGVVNDGTRSGPCTQGEAASAFGVKSDKVQSGQCAEKPESFIASRDMGGRETSIDIQFQSPVTSRMHHWNMLRPRLEQICLAHGVESVVCTVESSIWLRYKQRTGILMPRASKAHAHCREEKLHASSRAALQGGSETRRDETGREWIELVAARIGTERVVLKCDPSRRDLQAEYADSLESESVAEAVGDRLARVQWPWQRFLNGESARLKLMDAREIQAAHRSRSLEFSGGASGSASCDTSGGPSGNFSSRSSVDISTGQRALDAHLNMKICATAYAAACAIAHRTTFLSPVNTPRCNILSRSIGGLPEFISEPISDPISGFGSDITRDFTSRDQRGGVQDDNTRRCSHCGRMFEDQTHVVSGRDRRASSLLSRELVLFWRGRTWRVDAIDGWQRIEEDWLSSHAQTPHGVDRDASKRVPSDQIAETRKMGRDDTVRGSVFSRILVCESLPHESLRQGEGHSQDHGGLWIHVRWPNQLRSAVHSSIFGASKAEASKVAHRDSSFSQQHEIFRDEACKAASPFSMQEECCTNVRDTEIAQCAFCEHRRRESRLYMWHRTNQAFGHDSTNLQANPVIWNWFEGCMVALESGLELTVEGAWG
jgi:hypothetical protein